MTKTFLLLAVVLLVSDSAYGQDVPRPPNGATMPEATKSVPPSVSGAADPSKVTPLPPAPTHWTLDLDQADLQTLNQCIGDLPYKTAAPFVAKMNQSLKPMGK